MKKNWDSESHRSRRDYRTGATRRSSS